MNSSPQCITSEDINVSYRLFQVKRYLRNQCFEVAYFQSHNLVPQLPAVANDPSMLHLGIGLIR